MPDLPVVCTLDPAALKARKEDLLAILVSRAEGCEETENGYRLRFAASDDILTTIARTVNAERQCCRFLQFIVTVAPNGGPISLELAGPPGTREFIDALIAR